MIFSDPQVQECYQRNLTAVEGHSLEQRQVHALMAVHECFYSLEGPGSPGVDESIWHLLLPRLRPELRRWYERPNCGNRPAAAVLREYLMRFLREEF